MNQTTATLPQLFLLDDATIIHFRETLSEQDQQALDQLLGQRTADHPAAPMAATQPVEHFLIALLLEQHKTLQFLVSRLNYYDHKLYLRRVKNVSSEETRSAIGDPRLRHP
jgi:hypothetical protein